MERAQQQREKRAKKRQTDDLVDVLKLVFWVAIAGFVLNAIFG